MAIPSLSLFYYYTTLRHQVEVLQERLSRLENISRGATYRGPILMKFLDTSAAVPFQGLSHRV